MAEERVRYSDAELQEFKKIIQDKIAKAEKDFSGFRTHQTRSECKRVAID